MTHWLSTALRSGTILALTSALIWGYAFYVRMIIYALPPAGYYPYPVLILGAMVTTGLGWYNVEHGDDRLATNVGLALLYLTIAAGLLVAGISF